MMKRDVDLDRYCAFEWAHDLMSGHEGNWVVMDSVTTGLSDADEIVDMAIISKYGSTLFNSLIKPTVKVKGKEIHGITEEMLENAPTFPEVFPQIVEAIAGKVVVIYNSSFDYKKLRHCAEIHDLKLPRFKTSCALTWYAQYHGDWNSYWKSYTWQKLPDATHRALGDAKACYALIKSMARVLSSPIEPKILFPSKQFGCTWMALGRIEFSWFSGYRYWKLAINVPLWCWFVDRKIFLENNLDRLDGFSTHPLYPNESDTDPDRIPF